MSTLTTMLQDRHIWRSAGLVTLFNICLFSYYQLAPFQFERLGLSAEMFGYSGLLLALGVGLGSWLNKLLLARGWRSAAIVMVAAWLALCAAAGVVALSHSWLFVLPMVVVVLSYGLAIPNVLARALDHYTDRVGTAGALLGLLYYSMLATGLLLAGWSQNLGAVLMCCSVVALPLAASAYAASVRVHARA